MEVSKSRKDAKRPFLPHHVFILELFKGESSLIKHWFLNVRIMFYISYIIHNAVQMVDTQEIFID